MKRRIISSSTRLKIANAVWFQLVWWLLILWQTDAVVYVVGLFGLWFLFSPLRKSDALLALVLMGIGLTVDSILTYCGVFVFASGMITDVLIPIWLVLLWAGLACTLQHSMAMFSNRPLLCVLLGAISAPFSYLGGARMGAVELGYNHMTTYFIIGAVWSVVFPLCFIITAWVKKAVDGQLKPTDLNSTRTI